MTTLPAMNAPYTKFCATLVCSLYTYLLAHPTRKSANLRPQLLTQLRAMMYRIRTMLTICIHTLRPIVLSYSVATTTSKQSLTNPTFRSIHKSNIKTAMPPRKSIRESVKEIFPAWCIVSVLSAVPSYLEHYQWFSPPANFYMWTFLWTATFFASWKMRVKQGPVVIAANGSVGNLYMLKDLYDLT
jgi:hypothetical protein